MPQKVHLRFLDRIRLIALPSPPFFLARPMFGLLKKFKAGLAKTTQRLWRGVSGVFGVKHIDEATLEVLEESLYAADFGPETVSELIGEIRQAFRKNKDLQGQEAAGIGKSVLTQVLQGSEGHLPQANAVGEPQVICLIGVNGAGKTTTAAKLAYFLKNQGDNVLIGACDTFRAAANEQLQTWAKRLDLPLVSSHQGADAAAVAYDAYQAAKNRGAAWLILDTAGRLHTKEPLMRELQKLKNVLGKHNLAAPQHAWLVVDAGLGSNSLTQARAFHEAFGLTGLIVTKLDGTSKAGALVAIYRELKLPLYFVGFGESPDDLQPFDVGAYTDALFS